MIKQHDTEYRDVTIKEVDPQGVGEGWGITCSDGWSFFVLDKGVEPHVGDTARFYGRGLGSVVRGLDIEGREVFYRTPEQQQEHDARENERRAQERRDQYEANKTALDASFDSLPQEFKDRIAGLRERNPEFRWEYENYEMMVCVDAVRMARACESPDIGTQLKVHGIRLENGEWADDPAGRLQAFAAINSKANNYRYELQRELIPSLSDGHSGNSFGAAVRLAYLYLTQPDLVEKEHGALCPLVGCEDYGCYSLVANAA
jgi:hypothetical protein